MRKWITSAGILLLFWQTASCVFADNSISDSLPKVTSQRPDHSASVISPPSNSLALGLGYSYISLKYSPAKRFSVEARTAFGDGIIVSGGRLYFVVVSKSRTNLYLGPEFDYMHFDVEDVKGAGYLGMLFIGGEHFVSRRLGVVLDFGPAYIHLNDSQLVQGKQTVLNEWELVVNLGINLYFGGVK